MKYEIAKTESAVYSTDMPESVPAFFSKAEAEELAESVRATVDSMYMLTAREWVENGLEHR